MADFKNIATLTNPSLTPVDKNSLPGAGGATGGKETLLFAKVLEQNQMMNADLIKSMDLGMEGAKPLQSVAATDVHFDPKTMETVG
ncbi:MAG: hypothetical protein Q7S00_04345, partial [bacterium]|nr:hypothetical protein [bacterium]